MSISASRDSGGGSGGVGNVMSPGSSTRAYHHYPQPTAGPSHSSSSRLRDARRYHAHPGCTLCSIVSALPDYRSPYDGATGGQGSDSAVSPTTHTSFLASQPSSPAVSPIYSATDTPRSDRPNGDGAVLVAGREVLYWDDEITVLRASGKERLCGDGRHLIVVLNRHVQSVYDLSPADIPLLSHVLDTSRRILTRSPVTPAEAEKGKEAGGVRVGFVGTLLRDPQSPHAHLHAHAMAGPIDTKLPGAGFYRRNVVFGNMNWWSIEDLRAEIRESTSNNRVKSGYSNGRQGLIDRVPDAGSVAGPPNALDEDIYSDTPPASARLHPRDASVTPRPADRKGKGRTSAPQDGAENHPPPRTRSFASTSSVGSVRGDEEGYVAVDLQAGTRSRD
ncbi:hypothetical protein DB88DRAFT_489305 [Papiliotrema laurentii]|uniref:HIT domain-containing protein n=1 Tax=Papiliotrema laurentii TaxID=5418 RepID=A0AAD9FQP8_PAPLA|nr:hypothetical protein DB88DRAFT_489305 [Papiliotrema laurentii]